MELTKEFNFACSHRLEGHAGLCKNIHGHNYKVLVTVKHKIEAVSEVDGTSRGMVIDFKELKHIVNGVLDELDHAFVYNVGDSDSVDIAEFLVGKIKQKIFPVTFRTTTENLAKYIYHLLNL